MFFVGHGSFRYGFSFVEVVDANVFLFSLLDPLVLDEIDDESDPGTATDNGSEVVSEDEDDDVM